MKKSLSTPSLTPSTLTTLVEEHRSGYPRFAALLSVHAPFFICRRFNRLRARVLLLKQDELSVLEERLDKIDKEEACLLFLGQRRSDKNPERLSLMTEIESRLAEYDEFAERARSMLALDPAPLRDVYSLQNWLDGNGSLAREEEAYLTQTTDLCSLAPTRDHATRQIEIWVEDKLIRFYRGFRQRRSHDVSDDPNVYLYSGTMIAQISRALLLLLITLLLLVPIVVCNLVSTASVRIAVIVGSTISYLLIVSLLTRSKTMELILAGATYATVLIVFVSGTTNINN